MSLNRLKLFFITILSLTAFQSGAQEKPITMSLKECIQYGLQHHPSVKIAANTHQKGLQQIRESLSTYLPQVNFNMELDDNIRLQQTIIPEGMLGPGSPEQRIAFGTKYNSTMAVELDQKVFDYSRIISMQAIKYQKDFLNMQESQNGEDLIYNIAGAYYQILVAQKQLGLLLDNRDRLQRILQVTQLQAEQGVAKKADVKQVQVNLNNVLAQISSLNNSLEIARNNLKNNMGLNMSDSLEFSDTAKWLNQTPTLAAYPNFNYEQTLAAQMQRMEIVLDDYQRKSIKAQIMPTISVFARYGANGFGADFKGAYSPLLDYSAIGVKLNWSLFTGFRRDAQYKEAVLDWQNAQLNYDYNQSLMNLQYQNATSKSKEAKSTIFTNKENLSLASEVYDNTTLQYREGVASLSDLLNAELSYKEAQNNYINSLLDYYIADLNVQKANGTLKEYLEQL